VTSGLHIGQRAADASDPTIVTCQPSTS
jgi:hypothetical protein